MPAVSAHEAAEPPPDGARYDTFKKDAKDCQPCQQIWDELRRAEEQQLQRVTSHLQQHFGKESQSKAA